MSQKRVGQGHSIPSSHATPASHTRRGGRDWTGAFLAALAETGHNSRAARAAEVDYSTVWRRRQADAEFEGRYQEALKISATLLEEEAVRRARDGVHRMKFNAKTGLPYLDPATGQPYIEHEYSDSLLMALLKRHFPEHYRERQEVKMEHSGQVTTVTMTEERRKTLMEKKLRAIEANQAAQPGR